MINGDSRQVADDVGQFVTKRKKRRPGAIVRNPERRAGSVDFRSIQFLRLIHIETLSYRTFDAAVLGISLEIEKAEKRG